MFKKILNVLSTIILIILIVVVVFVFKARISGDAPNVFGYQIYRVSSGSMSPSLEIGDVILVKKTPPELIKKGDIVTYRGAKGDFTDKIITHMVVEEPKLIDGVYHFQTKGIAADTVPDPEITDKQVLGVYQQKIPVLNYLYSFFLTDFGLIAFIGVIVVLFGYELISLILSYKALDNYDDEYYEPKQKKKSKKKK